MASAVIVSDAGIETDAFTPLRIELTDFPEKFGLNKVEVEIRSICFAALGKHPPQEPGVNRLLIVNTVRKTVGLRIDSNPVLNKLMITAKSWRENTPRVLRLRSRTESEKSRAAKKQVSHRKNFSYDLIMKGYFILLTALFLFGCQNTMEIVEDPLDLTASSIFTDVQTFEFGDLGSSAWTSDSFSGSHKRQISNGVLQFQITQGHDEGGIDIGLHDTNSPARAVSEMSGSTAFCSSYDIDLRGEGRWWAGPKISVNWQGDESAKQNGDDWYENYIVEIASSTPDELDTIFTGDYFKAEVLPETIIEGARYKHYKIRFHDWWQFWSVRQDYRETGTVPITLILEVWKANGLPENRLLDGIKANIETYGDITGTGKMKIAVTSDSGPPLDCSL